MRIGGKGLKNTKVVFQKTGKKEEIKKEYQILKQLEQGVRQQDSYFPKVYRYEEFEDKAFLLMEKIQGETLLELSNKRKLKREEWLYWLKETAKGISCLHSQRPAILWCDCKPENLMIDKEGHIYLIDFNHACLLLKEVIEIRYGTKSYCAPEQIEGKPFDERTDIYGFGATFLQMPLKWYWFSIQKILKKCVAKKPEHRFQTMEELLYELKKL